MNINLRELFFERLKIEWLSNEMATVLGRNLSEQVNAFTETLIEMFFVLRMSFQPDTVKFFQNLILGIEVSCVNVYNPTLATAFQFTTSTVVDMPGIDDIASVNIICQLFENESVQFVKIFSGNIDICSRFIVLT